MKLKSKKLSKTDTRKPKAAKKVAVVAKNRTKSAAKAKIVTSVAKPAAKAKAAPQKRGVAAKRDRKATPAPVKAKSAPAQVVIQVPNETMTIPEILESHETQETVDIFGDQIQSDASPATGDANGVTAVVVQEEPSAADLAEEDVIVAKLREVTPPAPVVAEERGSYDGDTAYQLYLKEIGQHKLLTIEEENELAARIKKGDAAARERMINANLRLVVKIARDYEGYGVPLLDLISEGNIGLMKGVERFDPSKGAKLSTYSAWWIKQAIKRALANQGKTIRLPVHVVDKLFHIRRAEARLQEILGREPTDDEIAEELDSTPEKIRELRAASQRPASLEAPLGHDSDNRVADVVADENAEDPYDQVEEKANSAMLKDLLKDLDPREVTILRYRFGLDGDEEKTLEEVGRKFGLTRERIRQIQEIALKKLRKKIDKLEAVRRAA